MCNFGVADARGTGARFCTTITIALWAISSFALERGDIAPNFSLPILTNPSSVQAQAAEQAQSRFAVLNLSDYRGTVIYLDFWHSSCLPCRTSLPLLNSLREEFSRSDVEILAINSDLLPRTALEFISRHPVSYPVAHDIAAQVSKSYGVGRLPTAFFIARDGTVHAVHEGFERQDLAQIRKTLVALSLDKSSGDPTRRVTNAPIRTRVAANSAPAENTSLTNSSADSRARGLKWH